MKTRTIALGAAVVVAASILAVACAAEDAAAPHCYGAGRHDVLAPAALVKPVRPTRHAAPAPAKQPAAPARPVYPAATVRPTAPAGVGHSSPRASLSKVPAAPVRPTSPWAAASSPSSHRPHHPAPHHHAPHQHVEIDLDGDDC